MFRKTEKIETKKSNKVNDRFSTNPITSGGGTFDNINQQIEVLIQSKDVEEKYKGISEIVDSINSLSEHEILLLMSSNNELIRVIAARAYADKNPENLVFKLKKMLMNENEFIRDSAVASLCYLNSASNLNLLTKAANDKSSAIKLRALTGIADIAAEHSSKEAKEILKRFLNDKDPEVTQFVNDELSILG